MAAIFFGATGKWRTGTCLSFSIWQLVTDIMALQFCDDLAKTILGWAGRRVYVDDWRLVVTGWQLLLLGWPPLQQLTTTAPDTWGRWEGCAKQGCPLTWLRSDMLRELSCGLSQGCATCCSLAAGPRGNGERMRKWRENEEIERRWRENGEMDRE